MDHYYGGGDGNSNRKRRPNIYIFRPEDLDNDDVILAVESSPTYKRTSQTLEEIRKQSCIGVGEEKVEDKGEAQPCVISFA